MTNSVNEIADKGKNCEYRGIVVDLLMDTNDNNANNKSIFQNLIWSSYDRLNAREISKFNEFFVTTEKVAKWVGNTQSLHLYSNDVKKVLVCKSCSSCKDSKSLFNVIGCDKTYYIGLIVSLKISEKIILKNKRKRYEIINDFIKHINSESKISIFVKNNVMYECFHSLGEEDVVVIALSNSIDDCLNFVEFLRNLRIGKDKWFELTNSFLFQNTPFLKNNLSPTKIFCCNAFPEVQITCKNMVDDDFFVSVFSSQLEKYNVQIEKVEMSLGEYDYSFVLKSKPPESDDATNILWLYSKKELLNGESKFYNDYIARSKTVWKKETKIKNIEDQTQNDVLPNNNTIMNSKENDYMSKIVKDCNEKIIDYIGKFFYYGTHTDGFNYKNPKMGPYNNTIVSFLKEASATLGLASDCRWKDIVAKQIFVFIDSLDQYYRNTFTEEYIFDDKGNLDAKFKPINDAIVDMRSSFSHINRSHELFYHIPTSPLQYYGSFNSVIISYYRYIEKLFNFAYKKVHEKNTKQARIIFFLFFGTTNKIKVKTYLSCEYLPNEAKLVGFELPYEALFNLNKYFITLTHEIYHLIAPYDRCERNKLLTDIWKFYYIEENICSIFKNSERDTAHYKGGKNFNDYVRMQIEIFLHNLDFFEIYNCFVFGTKKTNIDKKVKYNNTLNCRSLVSLNEEIAAQFKTNGNNIFEFIISRFFDFVTDNEIDLQDKTCRFNEHEQICYHSELVSLIKDLSNRSTYLKHYPLNNDYLNNMLMLVNNIGEVICDNFMSQLCFEPNKAVEDYVEYMFKSYDFQLGEKDGLKLSTYNSANIKNTEFFTRLKLYFFYVSQFSNDNINLFEGISEFFNTCLDDFDAVYQDKRIKSIIFKMISLDDFILTTSNCCNENDKKSLFEEYRKISLDILSKENNVDDFEYSINLIEKLDLHTGYSEWSNDNDESVISSVKSLNNVKKKSFDNILYSLCNNNGFDHFNDKNGVSVIFDFQAYFNWINSCNECKKENEIVWFRGICNDTYNIIPSLFVNIGRMCETSPDVVNDIKPYAYQVSVIEQCYADTAKYSDIFMKYETPTANRQSVMQHYGAPTNLLDFSTDPYLSLYWALNPTKDDKNSLTTAVVYAFYVHEYFKTVNHIIELQGSRSDHNKFNKYLNAISSHSSLSDEYIIRDLSRSKTIEMLSDYENQLNECPDGSYYEKTCELSKFPMPVVLPQTNRRINAQSGTFVAYNLLPMKDKTKSSSKEMFDYLALNKIQEYYIDLCKSNGVEPKTYFLKKAIIPGFAKKRINALLSSCFNYSDKKVYPDLEVIFKNIDKNIVGYEL